MRDLHLCIMQYLIDYPGESDLSISRRYGVQPSTLCNLRKELGICPSSAQGIVSLCHVQYVIDQWGREDAKDIAERFGMSLNTVCQLQRDLGLYKARKKGTTPVADLTPWQLAKRAQYDTERLIGLLWRHGYRGWSRADVNWLCSREGRLHYG